MKVQIKKTINEKGIEWILTPNISIWLEYKRISKYIQGLINAKFYKEVYMNFLYTQEPVLEQVGNALQKEYDYIEDLFCTEVENTVSQSVKKNTFSSYEEMTSYKQIISFLSLFISTKDTLEDEWVMNIKSIGGDNLNIEQTVNGQVKKWTY